MLFSNAAVCGGGIRGATEQGLKQEKMFRICTQQSVPVFKETETPQCLIIVVDNIDLVSYYCILNQYPIHIFS